MNLRVVSFALRSSADKRTHAGMCPVWRKQNITQHAANSEPSHWILNTHYQSVLQSSLQCWARQAQQWRFSKLRCTAKACVRTHTAASSGRQGLGSGLPLWQHYFLSGTEWALRLASQASDKWGHCLRTVGYGCEEQGKKIRPPERASIYSAIHNDSLDDEKDWRLRWIWH